MSTEEAADAPSLNTTDLLRRDMRKDPDWIDRVVDSLNDTVYLTIDVDGLDPAIMPATGTPEPGGLSWYEILALLRATMARRTVVACDVVELSPMPGLVAPNFLCAKLIYKILGYRFAPAAALSRLTGRARLYTRYTPGRALVGPLRTGPAGAGSGPRRPGVYPACPGCSSGPGCPAASRSRSGAPWPKPGCCRTTCGRRPTRWGVRPKRGSGSSRPELSRLWRMHGRLAAARGEPSRGIAFLTKAVSQAERAHDSRAIGLAHYELGLCYRQVGDTAIVRDHITQAASALHAAGDRRHLAMVHSLSGVTLAQEGRLDEAMAALRHAERLALLVERGRRRSRRCAATRPTSR